MQSEHLAAHRVSRVASRGRDLARLLGIQHRRGAERLVPTDEAHTIVTRCQFSMDLLN